MSTPVSTPFYVVGGTLRPDSPSYVERPADQELPKLLLAGEYCYVLTSRQMGKSSLMARTHRRFQEQGLHSVTVDLTTLGSVAASADRWYYGFCHRVLKGLKLDVDLDAWWGERDRMPPVQRLVEFFGEVVLSATEDRVVVFVDEIDTTLSLPYSDDFFAALRACYNARATEPEFERLSFAFLGVATPGELIKDPHRTPFNIGRRVELADFTLDEAVPLAAGLGEDSAACRRVLERVFYWTGGHPYLTQKVCQLLGRAEGQRCLDEDVDEVVRQHFLEAESRRADDNLKYVRQRLQVSAHKMATLRLYRRVLLGREVKDEPLSPHQTALKLAGLVVTTAEGRLIVRNPLYRVVFDESWIREELPVDWNRRLAQAAAAVFLLSMGVWYWWVYPQTFMETIRQAEKDVPLEAFKNLSRVIGYQHVANRLYAEYFERRALEYEWKEDRDRALMMRLKALAYAPNQLRRVKAGNLWLSYHSLLHTFRSESSSNVAFSPDGTRVATGGGSDTTIRIWNTVTGEELASMRHGAGTRVFSLAQPIFSPDGFHILSSSMEGTIQIWDLSTGLEVATIQAGFIFADPSFSRDGTRVATGNHDGMVKVWDALSGAPVSPSMFQGSAIQSLVLSPDGKQVLTGSYDGTVRIWNATTGKATVERSLPGEEIVSVAFSSDGTRVAVGSSRGTTLILNAVKDKTSDGDMRIQQRARIQSVAFSPDGLSVVTASFDGTARIWDVLTGSALSDPMRHSSAVLRAFFSPNGSQVVTGTYSGVVRVWDTLTGLALTDPMWHGSRIGHGSQVGNVGFTADGSRVLTGSDSIVDESVVRLWAVSPSLHPSGPPKEVDLVGTVSFSYDGSRIATSGSTVRVWDGKTGLPVSSPLPKAFGSLGISADGSRVATLGADSVARVWDISSGTTLAEIPLDSRAPILSLSRDGSRLVTGTLEGSVRFWDVSTGIALSEPTKSSSRVFDVSFNSDGSRVVAGNQEGIAQIWDSKGRSIGPYLQVRNSLMQVAFSPDDSLIVTGSVEGVMLWESPSGRVFADLGRFTNVASFRSVSFSRDGELLLIITEGWVHLFSISELVKPKHLASRFLWIPQTVGPVPRTSDGVRVVDYQTNDCLEFATVGPSNEDGFALKGDPEELLRKAEEKLSLRFDARDTLEVAYPQSSGSEPPR